LEIVGLPRRSLLRGTAGGALGVTSLALAPATAHASVTEVAGSAYGGGTFVGIIETVGFSGSDYSYEPRSTGPRYALVVCPQAYEPATNRRGAGELVLRGRRLPVGRPREHDRGHHGGWGGDRLDPPAVRVLRGHQH
jgi:hypothetical protein